MPENIEKNTELKARNLPLSAIRLSTYNARRFDENMTPERQAKFDELTASVAQQGVIQPIAVRLVEGSEDEGNAFYEIIAGERRYRACCRVANETGTDLEASIIPSVIHDVDDDTAFDMMTTENLQREDLSPIEKAKSFKDIVERSGNTVDTIKDLSRRFGIAPHAIRLQIALLDLPKVVLDEWENGNISIAHAEELSRLAGEDEILSALTECLRQRFTVSELSHFIKTQKPALKTAHFDKTECLSCHSNSAMQGTLFLSGSDEGTCLHPVCFKKKQAEFIKANWDRSKAKNVFATNDFRFKEDLTVSDYRVLNHEQLADRCKSCPEYVSAISLIGGIIKGCESLCVGSNACHDELYAQQPEPKKEEVTEGSEQAESSETSSQSGSDSEAPSLEKKEKAEKVEPTLDPKRSAQRGETTRESLYETLLPEKINALSASGEAAVRLYLIAAALESTSAGSVLREKFGISQFDNKELIAKVQEMAVPDLLATLLQMSLAVIMAKSDGYSSKSSPEVRDLLASYLGVDLQTDWVITEDYLTPMKKSEIVLIGEEPNVDLWNDEKVKAYKQEHFGKKGWMSLKKGDLIDCILKSGADLSGKVPQEVLLRKKA